MIISWDKKHTALFQTQNCQHVRKNICTIIRKYVTGAQLGFLARKRPNLAQNMLSWAHIGLAGLFGALLVGGCGARAVTTGP